MKSDTNFKKVLIIAYHFPPDAAVGALRPAKFVKYLPQWGWQPFVLTIQQKHIVLKDPGRLKEVEQVPTSRTSVWPTILQLALRLRDGFLAFGKGRCRDRLCQAVEMSLASENQQTVVSFSFIKTLKRYMDSLLELPDKQIGWLVPAVWRAYHLIKKNDIKVVVTSSPPRTTALVGLVLSYLLNIDLLTDLRDPWYRPIGGTAASQTRLSNKIMGWIEREIMVRSTRVIATNEKYRSFLSSYYEEIPQEKFLTIWNGYDQDDFKPFEEIRPGEKFTFSYLGTFYFGRTPKPFLNALDELVREGKIDKAQVEVRFIGDVHHAEGESVENMIRSHGLTDCVKILDPVPHKDSLKAMKESNVLLLFAPDQYYCIPAKAFEYLGSGRNILCFSKDGATAELINKTGSGVVVDPDNINEIKSGILNFYSKFGMGSMSNPIDGFYQYERSILTSVFARYLEDAGSKSGLIKTIN